VQQSEARRAAHHSWLLHFGHLEVAIAHAEPRENPLAAKIGKASTAHALDNFTQERVAVARVDHSWPVAPLSGVSSPDSKCQYRRTAGIA